MTFKNAHWGVAGDWENWTDQFRPERYHKTTTGVKGEGMPVIEVDGSNAYASSDGIRAMQLSFFHVPSQKAVYFKAFIVAYNETFNSDWASETVYGRTDPIYMFKGTQRQISLNFKVPAFSEGEAYENLGRVQKLTQYLYPSYTTDGIIGQSPLIRMKVMNLAQKQTIAGTDASQQIVAQAYRHQASEESGSFLYDTYGSNGGNRADAGILGVIGSLQINHNLEEQGVLEKGYNCILPKLLDVAVTFNCIHEHTLGFDQQGNALSPGFPYGVTLQQPYSPDDGATTYDQRVIAARAQQEDEDVRQQQIDNAKARYSGMFGKNGFLGIGQGRYGRDVRKADKGKLSPYAASALAGQIDHGDTWLGQTLPGDWRELRSEWSENWKGGK